ncbi:uncharacterized protein LOC132902432 [Amyelois transitella]|uniref:uncharacterized protein LOC132902432 n=1 Tax=Amyelois transitella TaxID=680683 RepID=UPI00299058D3|nr:uncharacterized protein LOC132902432 [Amyelois transitella]
MSGIDPRYLAAYADPNANFIATGQQMQRERGTISANPSFAGDYQNRMPQERNSMELAQTRMRNEQVTQPPKIFETPTPYQRNSQNNWKPVTNTPIKKPEASDVNKPEIQNQIMSRGDKLKALHRSGARVFSGPVEKVLKWHKALQDIGVYVLYEIVAKCVNIRPGEPCSKNLVVRDESGPAMQIVYYEVDFLLPELKPPCTVRILGRMMSGTSRFQAFSVRPATGDDAAALPRRAAVAAHHVSKLCKEYTV